MVKFILLVLSLFVASCARKAGMLSQSHQNSYSQDKVEMHPVQISNAYSERILNFNEGDSIFPYEIPQPAHRYMQAVDPKNGVQKVEAFIIAKYFFQTYISPEGNLTYLGKNDYNWQFSVHTGILMQKVGDNLQINISNGTASWKSSRRRIHYTFDEMKKHIDIRYK